jgi:hypothetical protein
MAEQLPPRQLTYEQQVARLLAWGRGGRALNKIYLGDRGDSPEQSEESGSQS